MAGAGYKLFNTGDVLLASEVNTYLMQQTVMVFANSTARTSALSGVLAEGMISYLADTNATEVYDGSSWVSVSGTGDITAVTTGANSGLAGGVTTGNADIKINFASKGQLAVGTGSGTTDFLTVGTNGDTLVADSSTSTGLKWAAASTGKVVQIVNASTNTETAVLNSTTYTDSTLSATITPTSASNKILVIVNQMGCKKAGTSTGSAVKAQLLRNSTSILVFSQYGGYTNSNSQNEFASMSCNYLDSPATTSATTYKTQIANQTASNSEAIVQSNSAYSTITLIEVTP